MEPGEESGGGDGRHPGLLLLHHHEHHHQDPAGQHKVRAFIGLGLGIRSDREPTVLAGSGSRMKILDPDS